VTVPEKVITTVGGTVDVDVPEFGTSGYVWGIAALPDGVELVSEELIRQHGKRIGGGGTRRFRLRAVEPGTHVITLHLRRSWEAAPKEEMAVCVDARTDER
jgi:predicted secreted protein